MFVKMSEDWTIISKFGFNKMTELCCTLTLNNLLTNENIQNDNSSSTILLKTMLLLIKAEIKFKMFLLLTLTHHGKGEAFQM